MKDFSKLYAKEYYSGRLSNDTKRLLSFDLEGQLIRKYKHSGIVCDVGCSTGEFLNHIRWQGDKYGMEISEFARKEAEKTAISFEKNILTVNNYFDLIVFRGTIQHLPEPFLYIQKSFESLKSGGVVAFLATPNSNSIYYKLFNTLPFLAPELNFYIPSDLTLSSALNNFGFEIKEIQYPYVGSPYQKLISDHIKFLKKLVFRTDDKFAFYKSMMNLIAIKP